MKGSGLDDVSNILVTWLGYTIRIPPTKIYNKPLIVATFIDMCKINKVITLHTGAELANDNIDLYLVDSFVNNLKKCRHTG